MCQISNTFSEVNITKRIIGNFVKLIKFISCEYFTFEILLYLNPPGTFQKLSAIHNGGGLKTIKIVHEFLKIKLQRDHFLLKGSNNTSTQICYKHIFSQSDSFTWQYINVFPKIDHQKQCLLVPKEEEFLWHRQKPIVNFVWWCMCIVK